MQTSSTRELKELQTRRDRHQEKLKLLKTQRSDIDRQIGQESKCVDEINRQIASLSESRKEIVVSEHAILRYIERVMGISIDEMKAKVLPVKTRELLKSMPSNGTFPVDTHLVKLKDGVVVTVLAEGEVE
jgi:chromosome segregation ATPase